MSNDTPGVEIQQEERKNNLPTHHNAQWQDLIQQEERKKMSNDTSGVEIQQEERKNNLPTHLNVR